MNELEFSTNREGMKEFSEMVAALQEAGARFQTDRSGQLLIIRILHGQE